jgi:hypothetical protein
VQDVLSITGQLALVCERLGLRYVIGGSIASSLHGLPRSTQDVDLVVEIALRDVPSFVHALRDDFYLDEDAIRDAIERSSSFNVIHLESYFKADVFVARDDEPSHRVSERQRADAIGVLKVSGPTLDLAYLRHASSLFGVESLLHEACDEAGLSLPRA